MLINNHEIDVLQAIKFANCNNYLLKRRNNGIILSDYQVNVLKRNGFCYEKYSNLQELLFDVEEYLNCEFDDELDIVSGQISELLYYSETKK